MRVANPSLLGYYRIVRCWLQSKQLDDVKTALEDLSTVGGVTVTRSHIGLARGSDGVSFPLTINGTSNVTSLFSVWTVAFDGECSFEENGWTSCPVNVGDLEVRGIGNALFCALAFAC